MHRKFFFLFTSLLLLPMMADAAWWWPFGNNHEELPAAEQTALSRPIYEAAVEARSNDKPGTAARKFKDVWENHPGSIYTPDALYQYGQIKFEQQDWRDSFRAFQQLLSGHPDFPYFNEVTRYMFEIALANAAGENTRWFFVFPYRAYERAVAYFEALLVFAPYSDLAPLALMNVALIHQYLDNTPEAIDALDRMINFYPASLLADNAYLELGDTFADLTDGPLYDQGATREAMSYYEDFLVLFPNHENVGEGEEGLAAMRNQYAASKLVLGKYYYNYRNWFYSPEMCEIFFNEAISIAPNSEAAAEAREYLAQIEAYKQAALNNPDFEPPYTSLVDRILFWRDRSGGPAPAAAAEDARETFEEASPASGPDAMDIDR